MAGNWLITRRENRHDAMRRRKMTVILGAAGAIVVFAGTQFYVSSGSSSPASGEENACKLPRVIPASNLRIPLDLTCSLNKRTVQYHQLTVKFPSSGTICRTQVDDSARLSLCVGHDGTEGYSVASESTVPRACTDTGSIPAQALRTPVARNTCALVGRQVTYKSAGLVISHRNGTECNYQTTSDGDVGLCVTVDSKFIFATVSQ
jgi:hypothetical protein